MLTMSSDLATAMKLDASQRGALIEDVVSGGPAEQAGLHPDDIIVAVQGRPVQDLQHFHRLLLRHTPGDEVSLTIRRGGETALLSAVLVADRP